MEDHLDEADRLGRQLVAALAEPEAYIRRRVETIELLSYELVRREVAIELTLHDPALWRWEPADPGSPLVVPISLLRKQPLRHYAVLDGDDPVSALRAAETAALLEHGVESLAGRLATDTRVDALRRVILEEPDAATLAVALELAATDARLEALIRSLDDVFVLTAELPAQSGPGSRVVSYSFDEPYLTVPRSRAGLRPTRYRLRMLGAELCASFHAEVVIPEEARAPQARLLTGEDEVLDADDEADRPSLHAPRRLRREDRTEVLVDVLTQRPIFYTPALTLAATELVLLLAGAVVALAGQRFQGAAVPLLFAGFAAITGLVIRAGESPFVRAMLSGGRAALVVSTGLVLVAAAMVAGGASASVIAVAWLVLAGLSLPSFTALALGWREARPGVDGEGVRSPHRPNVD